MLNMESDEDQDIVITTPRITTTTTPTTTPTLRVTRTTTTSRITMQVQQQKCIKNRHKINCRHNGKIMSRKLTILLSFLLIFVTNSWPTTQAAKILGLFAHPSESHFAVMRTVMTELARRQHNITIISSHRLNEDVDNLKEIIVEPEFQFWHKLQLTAGVRNGLHELSQISDSNLQDSLAIVGAASTEYFLSNERVQEFLRTTTVAFDYDLIIVDLFHTEALLMFGELFNKPTIALISSNFENYMTRLLDTVMPIACSPIDFVESHYVRDAGFWKRLSSVRQCMARRRQFIQGNVAAQQKLIAKYFSHHKEPLPTVAELHAKLAVLLVNNHVPLAKPRPFLPNIIPVGGVQVRRPRELPWHLRRFLDEARSGAIVVNLGNELMCKEIPKTTLSILFSVLGRNKQQRVIWTCHDVDRLDGMPANMMLQHMVPQTDILAHPMVNLFVMNGDLLSLQEGILRQVPMLGIPIFREEHENMNHAVTLGVGLKLDYANISEASLSWALETVLKDYSYPLTIREVAEIFRNRPLGALETTMYWVDYVLKYRGASHIRTPGLDIASNHLHLYDLFICYFVMTLVIVGTSIFLIYVAHILWRRHQTEKMYSKLS